MVRFLTRSSGRDLVSRQFGGRDPGSSVSVPDAEFSRVSFSPDGKTLLGGEYIGTWRLVSSEGEVLRSGQPELTVQDDLSVIALCPTGRRFATATRAGRVTLWNADTGKVEIEEMDSGKGGNRDLHALAFSPDGRWLAGAIGFLGEKMVHVWDIPSGELRFNMALPEPGRSVSFSPSGRYLLVTTEKYGTREGEACVWDLGTGLAATPRIASVYMAHGERPRTRSSLRGRIRWSRFGKYSTKRRQSCRLASSSGCEQAS